MSTKWTLRYEDEDGEDRQLEFEEPFALWREDAGFSCEAWTPEDTEDDLHYTLMGRQAVEHDKHGLCAVTTLKDPASRSTEE